MPLSYKTVGAVRAEQVCREELEMDNFEYEFNEIVVNQLVDLDPQYVIDMETIKELLIEQQENLTGETDWLLQAKRERHPEAYEGYKEALESDRDG